MLTTRDIAARLQVSEGQVRRWAREGDLPSSWLGKRVGYRFTSADVDAFIEHMRQEHEARQSAARAPSPPEGKS